MEEGEIVAEQVEQVNATLRLVKVRAREHPQEACVALGARAVRSGNRRRRVDPVLLGCERPRREAHRRQVEHRGSGPGGLLPQRGLVPAGGEVEDLTPAGGSGRASVSGPGEPLHALRHHRETFLVAGGQRLVEKQRQRLASLFLRLDPRQSHRKQQLHAGPRRKLRELPCRLLRDIASDEGPVAPKPQLEGPGGHFREQVPSPAQHGRLVLRLERPFHVVEQRPGGHREERIVALVFQSLPRRALLRGGPLQLAFLPGVVQPGPDRGVLPDQARMLGGLDVGCLQLRLQARAFPFVGERDEVGLLRQADTDQRFFRFRGVQRGVRFLPPRKLFDPGGERGPIAGFDAGPSEQVFHGVVHLREPLLQ